MAQTAAIAARADDAARSFIVTMPADAKTPDGFSLKRWSRRKLHATREPAPAATAPVPAVTAPIVETPAAAMPAPLPPVESLTVDSDFTAFLQPKVDEAVKRQALKKLFADPRFNVMDGLDVYIDDYTKTVPVPPDVLRQLMENFTFNPPIAPDPTPQDPQAEAPTETVPVTQAAPAPAPEADASSESTAAPDVIPAPQTPTPSQ
jgi:hypothetical protein